MPRISPSANVQSRSTAGSRTVTRAATAAVALHSQRPAVRVLRQFRQIFGAIRQHFRTVEKKAGVGGAQLWALSVIGAKPAIGVNDLAASMDVHQSTASNVVRGLLDTGLVASLRLDEDRRRVALRLLPAGRRVLRRAPGPFPGVLPDALSRLDARTLARLERDLDELIGVLEVTGRASRTPLGES